MKFLDIEPITRQEQVVMDDLESKLQRAYKGENNLTGETKPIFSNCMFCKDLIDAKTSERLYLSDFQRKVLDTYKVGVYSHGLDTTIECNKMLCYNDVKNS